MVAIVIDIFVMVLAMIRTHVWRVALRMTYASSLS